MANNPSYPEYDMSDSFSEIWAHALQLSLDEALTEEWREYFKSVSIICDILKETDFE